MMSCLTLCIAVGLLLSSALARAEDLALDPPAINTSPGPEYSDAARGFGMTIGIDRTRGGRLWAAWVAGGDSELGYFVVASSDDDGATWSRPRLVIDPADAPSGLPRRTLVGNLWTDPTGRLWLFFDQSMGYFDGRAGAWAITSDNPDAEQPAWSAPRRIWHGATLNKPTVLADGTWLMPISLWQRDRIHAATESRFRAVDPKSIPSDFRDRFHELDGQRMAHVFASTDRGATWVRRGGVAFARFDFDEHMTVELRDGRLWMLARTLDGIAESYSPDQGRTWSAPQMRFPHINARFHLRRLASGNLLLVRHGRMDERTKRRSHLTAFLSDDDGRTWRGGLVLDERDGVSYPDGFQAPDGRIFISYDRERAKEREILLAVFTEADVLAGKPVSGTARLKQLIDKATGPAREAPRAASAAPRDPALEPPPIDTAPGPEYADGTRLFQGIPGIERAANGRLWALWYAGGPNEPGEGPGNYVVLVTSGDDGRSWSPPRLVIDPPGLVRAYDPCLWHDPDGRLWLFWAQSFGWWDGRSGVWCIVTENSGNESPRWSAPRRLCNGIMMNKPTVLRSGEWLLPAAVWAQPPTGQIPPEHRHPLGSESGANVHVSRDKGATWTLLGHVHVPSRVFDEHMVVERGDGSLWMLVRAAYGIGESESTDGGRTWAPGRKSAIRHVNSRFFIRRLRSGKLLLVTHEPPEGKTRSHLVAHLSDDDGKTWRGGLMIDERAGVSYPDGVQAPDGTIYLIYDYSRTGARQILMAAFTEEDVASGQWRSENARSRVAVNQATGRRQPPAKPAAD